MKQPEDEYRKVAVQEWASTPSPNPRYKGATPAEVVRVLIKPVTPERNTEEKPAVKSGV